MICNRFSTFLVFLELSKEVFPQNLQHLIIEHLYILTHLFQKCFPVSDENSNRIVVHLLYKCHRNSWFRNDTRK